MLTKFAVTNYRGFEKRIEWDLTKVRNYEFNTSAIRDNVVKNGIIYGPNGSGKSNFGLAIFDIVYHLSQKFKKIDYYENFIFAGNQANEVLFEYTFRFDKDIVEYIYAKNSHAELKRERLTINSKNIFSWEDNRFDIDSNQFPMVNAIKKRLSENSNHISIISFLLTSYPLPKNHPIITLFKFVDSMLWFRSLEQREFIGLEPNIDSIDEYIIRNGFVKDFENFLKKVSDQKFDFVEPLPQDKRLVCLVKNVPVFFNKITSTGTHALSLLYFWIKHMRKASFVFIDEFDAFYHFKLSREICKQLFQLNCQVFLTSHNTLLLTNDLLRPDCNFLMDNNKVKALHDCTDKELRFGHNIEKLYRGGAFEI